jgi:hypothetical protein
MSGYFDRGGTTGGQDEGYFNQDNVTGPEGVGTALGGPGGAAHADESAAGDARTPRSEPLVEEGGARLDETAGSSDPRKHVGDPGPDLPQDSGGQ